MKKAIKSSLIVIGVLFLVFIIIPSFIDAVKVGIKEGSKTYKEDMAKSDTSPTPIADQTWINDEAQKYYDTHISMRWSPTQFYGGKLTPDVAKKVIQQCIDTFQSKDKCEEVVNKKFWIGMPEVWAMMSVGNPDDINTTVVADKTHKQYVYGDPLGQATFVYFDNDVLTSYQQ